MVMLFISAMIVGPGRAYAEQVQDVCPTGHTQENPVQDHMMHPEVYKQEMRFTNLAQAFVVSLFDDAAVHATYKETQVGQLKQANLTTRQSLTKTGDDTNYLPVVALAAAGAAVIAVALIKRKKGSEEDDSDE